jgi:serine/threonine-protein kinase
MPRWAWEVPAELAAAPTLPTRPAHAPRPPRPRSQVTIPLASGLRGYVGAVAREPDGKEERDEREARGSLRLAAHPWAEVSIDGRPVGTTPLRPTTLAAGTHVVSLRNGELGVSIKRRVTIQAGKESVLVVDLFAEPR